MFRNMPLYLPFAEVSACGRRSHNNWTKQPAAERWQDKACGASHRSTNQHHARAPKGNAVKDFRAVRTGLDVNWGI